MIDLDYLAAVVAGMVDDQVIRNQRMLADVLFNQHLVVGMLITLTLVVAVLAFAVFVLYRQSQADDVSRKAEGKERAKEREEFRELLALTRAFSLSASKRGECAVAATEGLAKKIDETNAAADRMGVKVEEATATVAEASRVMATSPAAPPAVTVVVNQSPAATDPGTQPVPAAASNEGVK